MLYLTGDLKIMMLRLDDEEMELYNKLKTCTDEKEILEIHKNLKEFNNARQEKLKDLPFAH